MVSKSPALHLVCALALAAAAFGLATQTLRPAPACGSMPSPPAAAHVPPAARSLYAVNQSCAARGSVSVYDIERGHRLLKTIPTVAGVDDVKGVAASAATAKLYVAYRTRTGAGMIYALNLTNDAVLWNKHIDPDVDRLSVSPDGRLLYVPTWEGGSAGYINVLDADTGAAVRRVDFSNRSHDTLYPLSGPLFQETKAEDGSGRYLYLIDPKTYAVSRIGPYAGILGPYAVDGISRYAVNTVIGLWGLQVADLATGAIVTARLPDPPSDPWLLQHGIAFAPDEREVWQSGAADPHVYIWDMAQPMLPVFKERLRLKTAGGPHWVTFDLRGDYAYVAPPKNSEDATEIFDARSHASVGLIGSSEDLLEIDFADGKVSQVGDQYGIGRVRR